MLPYLTGENENSKKYIVNFRGLNYGEAYLDGELSDCKNLSSILSPCITQRYGRTEEGSFPAADGLVAKKGLVIVSPPNIIYNGETINLGLTEGRKHTATVGNYIVIFPDKKYYNVETKEYGSMAASITTTGAVFTDSTITITDGKFPFRAGDAVTISGCTTEGNNKSVIIREITDTVITVYKDTLEATTEAGAITLSREIPDMDVICESNYRLWGAKGNTIYGSKYSDPLNFNVFDGLSGDSYFIDVGTDGEFTGCIAYSSHICFFKEHVLHKMYGVKPSNFQLTTTQVYGVQAGSERSMRVINETLFYKGVNGVYAYAGGVPELLTANFGTKRFSEACAESDGERYYISMKNGDKWSLYVYDVLKDMWLKEDDLQCKDMAFVDGYVYMLTADGELIKIDPEASRDDLEWSLTFCPFTETINERKGYSKFHLRMELTEGAWLQVEVKRDNAPKWQQVYVTHNERARTLSIPILPERSDSIEIRISGKGICLIRTFVREFYVGSDV